MTLGYPFLAAVGRGVVIDVAVRDVSWARELLHPHLDFGLLIVSIAVISIARVLGQAVSLQEDADATI